MDAKVEEYFARREGGGVDGVSDGGGRVGKGGKEGEREGEGEGNIRLMKKKKKKNTSPSSRAPKRTPTYHPWTDTSPTPNLPFPLTGRLENAQKGSGDILAVPIGRGT